MGLILYMKLSVTGNELEMIKRYRTVHPDFPHQTTLDQFFDEEQFEAYRQLGVHAAEGLFSRALLQDCVNPISVSDWFAGLARNKGRLTELRLPPRQQTHFKPSNCTGELKHAPHPWLAWS